MLENAAYALFLIAGVFGYLATLLVRAIAIRIGFVDQPNPIVPQHTLPVALAGGVAIAIGFLLALVGVYAVDGLLRPDIPNNLALTWLVPLLAFLVLGFVDDVVRLTPRIKLMAQMVAAAGAVSVGWECAFTGVGIIDTALSWLWIVLIVNAVNLTDVCDGLVAGMVAITLLALGHADGNGAILAVILSGACVGFLVLNAPPAKIFLGDAGSHFLGAALAGTTLTSAVGGTAGPPLVYMVLLTSPFLFELTLLVIVRHRKGLAFWRGSSDHFSLRLQAAGLTRLQTVLVAWLVTAVCSVEALAASEVGVAVRWALLLFTAAGFVVCWRYVLRHDVPSSPLSSGNGRPPRILWIHQNLVTARQAGNTRPIYILAGLLERGCRIDVITTQGGYFEESFEGTGQVVIEEEGNLTIHRLPTSGGLHRRSLAVASFFLRALWHLRRVGRTDVVFVSSPPSPQILLSVIASVWKSAPMVLEIRDLWPAFLIRFGLVRSFPVVAMLEWLEALGHRCARRFISVSPGFGDYLVAMGVREEATTVVPSGADASWPSASRPDRRTWRHRWGLDDKFVVVYTGSFNEAYALHVALEAVGQVADLRDDIAWVFLGNGRCRGLVESTAARHSTCHYLGVSPRNELHAVYHGADLGLLCLADDPMVKTAIQGKLLEYLAFGLPIVSMVNGSSSAIVRKAGAGFVVAEASAEKLAAAVIHCADMPRDELRRIGARGRRWGLRHMSATDTGRRAASVIAECSMNGAPQSNTLRAAYAGVAAGVDVLTRRSRRATQACLRTDMSATVDRCIDEWLAECHSKRTNGRGPATGIESTCNLEPVRAPEYPGDHACCLEPDQALHIPKMLFT